MIIRSLLVMAFVAGLLGTGVAFSQNPSPAKPMSADKAKPVAAKKATAISKREWTRLKRKLSKQADKWAGCNKQADDQKLIAPESWSFIASCMTS